ncbi:winged helix-turn-helix domain-containing protein [Scandinavium sp.]|uniref:winged helix-turn-helix domain-containing protein n=1 Tax=Scandinavium sp. TaxID=2830653 RepID=UPI0028975BBA|nr:winged helix-turn-helix domain-containing protein [Scandinavium sp.]
MFQEIEKDDFLIGERVIFRPLDQSLRGNDGEGDVVVLRMLPSRLLLFLIAHRDQVHSREVLLNAVWEQYGLLASGHSLNQNIAVLRKVLQEFGCPADVIRTIPRAGFLLDSAYVQRLENRNPVFPVMVIPAEKTTPPPIKRNPARAKAVVAFVAMGALVAGALLMRLPAFSGNDWRQYARPQPLYFAGKIESCPVYSTAPFSAYAGTVMMRYVRLFAGHKKQACVTDTFYLVYGRELMQTGEGGQIFIARCGRDPFNAETIRGCNSDYEQLTEK